MLSRRFPAQLHSGGPRSARRNDWGLSAVHRPRSSKEGSTSGWTSTSPAGSAARSTVAESCGRSPPAPSTSRWAASRSPRPAFRCLICATSRDADPPDAGNQNHRLRGLSTNRARLSEAAQRPLKTGADGVVRPLAARSRSVDMNAAAAHVAAASEMRAAEMRAAEVRSAHSAEVRARRPVERRSKRMCHGCSHRTSHRPPKWPTRSPLR